MAAMKYSLLMFVTREVGLFGAIFGCIIAVVFMSVGIVIMRIPVQTWMRWDSSGRIRSRAGRWIYERELKTSGDENRAIAKAASFYWLFGAFFVVMGLIQVVVWTCKALLEISRP